MTKKIIKEGLEYTKSNRRMCYNKEFHENHRHPYTGEELVYLCTMYDSAKKADLAMALGRTPGSVMTEAYELRKNGLFDIYKNRGKQIK